MPAKIPEEQLITLSEFPGGVNNVAREDSLPPGTLRAAVNVDLLGTGKIRRRPGYTRVISGTRMHSVYANPEFPWLLYCDNGSLYATDRTTTIEVRSGLAPSRDLSYAYANRCVWWSNGLVTGRVTEAATDAAWGVENPKSQPLLAAVDGGALQAGWYQVAVTFIDTNGEESGSTLAAMIEVGTNQAITLTSIPQPTSADVMLVRIYLTPCNGDVFYRFRDLAVGMTSTTITNVTAIHGKVLDSQFLDAMPPGNMVAYYNGRLLSASGRTVWFSEPMRYGLCRASDGFWSFPGDIRMIAPVGQGGNGGIYVATGTHTFYLAGAEPGQSQRLVAYAYGAVEGSVCYAPGSAFAGDAALGSDLVPVWVATNGVFVAGGPQGRAVPLTENRLSLPDHDRGASIFREWRGARQVVSALRGARAGETFGARDVAVAEVVRNGITLP